MTKARGEEEEAVLAMDNKENCHVFLDCNLTRRKKLAEARASGVVVNFPLLVSATV